MRETPMKWCKGSPTRDQEPWIGFPWLFIACSIVCALLILKPILGLGLIVGTVGFYVLVCLFVSTLSGKIEPVILTWVVVRYFRVEENAATLHLVTSLMALYVAGIGVAEVVLRQDLLPLPGGEITFAGGLPRPNGPFWTNDSFALIGLVTFLLLLFLRNLLGENVSLWRRVVHYVGLTASLAMALMPMFRSVGISLMVILLIATLSTRKPSRRLAGFALFLLCFSMVSLVSILAPDAYADRSRSGNVYGRLAEQMQTWHVFA